MNINLRHFVARYNRLQLLLLFFLFACFKQATSQAKVKAPDQIPIMTFGGIPYNETSITRYEELKASGVTHALSSFPNMQALQRTLKIAHKAGIKMIVNCPELKTDTKHTIKMLKNKPAIAGYFIQDEPNSRKFNSLAEQVKKIRSIDDTHFCYINLFPNYADTLQLGTRTYKGYVHKFITEVPVKHLSFDNYPVVGDSLRQKWYKNLEIFSKETQKAGKPFWGFALTVSHGPYPIPTVAMLKLEVFSDLAYGAQGIQYFYYWTHKDPVWNYHQGPITLGGKRSTVYDRMKEVNQQIKDLSWIFLGARVISVAHTGDTIPQGTRRLTVLPKPIKKLTTEGEGAVVSVLKNGKMSFLVIVNRDFRHMMKLTINCDSTVSKILKDGSMVPASVYSPAMEIDPGDVAIYGWND
jgi:hypothetical protein